MATALGTATPMAFKVGSTDCTAIYFGAGLAWQAAATAVLVASENFTGADGAAWPSQWTALRALGAATQVGGKGRQQTDVGYKTYRDVLAGVNLKNVEVYAEFTPRALTECYPEVSVRQSTTATGPYADGHFVNMYMNPTAGGATFTMGGSLTATGSFNTATGNVGTWTIEPWAVRLRAVNSTVTAKVWKVSAGESSAVTQTITDTNFDRAGGVALAYNSGNTTDPGVDWDNVKVYDLGGNTSSGGTTTPPSSTTYSYSFDGTNGATYPAGWTMAKGIYSDAAYPTTPVTIQGNKLRVQANDATAWSYQQQGGSIFLGDPNTPQGNSATSIPPIMSNGTYTFDMDLRNTSEQYPSVGIRLRSAQLWASGGGKDQFRHGGYSLQMGTAQNTVSVIENYSGRVITTFPFTFSTAALRWEITLFRKRLTVRIWAQSGSRPSTATFDSDGVLFDESDGNIGFAIANGPAAEQKYMDINNLTWAPVDVSGIGTTVSAPTTEPAGFTRIYTENFDDVAPAGTGTSSFLNVYSTRVQPYDEVSPKYQQRALLSAHDGVMDVAMNGTQGAAWAYGSASTANGFIGGRFSARIKTVGAYNNGPAWMIWPSNNAWVEGEIDFPESVSGPGGTQGFQDSPFIHHHTMNTDHPNDQAAAQDVNLGASWREWHVYTAEWYPPGKGPTTASLASGMLIYYVDNVEVYRTTTDIPKTYHRFMAQVGEYGTPGNMYIDYITMATKN